MKIDTRLVDRLRRRAVEAASRSYSPYSQFPVGAAVVSRNGSIYAGCNVENASFGLTQCAERAALTTAIAAGEQPGDLVCLVIYIPGDARHPPCGACRQVMRELMSPDSRVYSFGDGEAYRVWSADEYLPDPFTPESLLR